jgi:hypothetical protein
MENQGVEIEVDRYFLLLLSESMHRRSLPRFIKNGIHEKSQSYVDVDTCLSVKG